MTAEIAVRHPQPVGKLLGDKHTNLGPQGLAFGRQLDRIEMEGGHRSLSGGGLTEVSSCWTTARSGGKWFCNVVHT